jgi:hypothetical protein
MLTLARRLLPLAVLAVAVAACGGGGSSLLPRHQAAPTPSMSALPMGQLIPATQVTTDLKAVGAYYATLPHASINTDLQSVATHMVTSGVYTSATVLPGGISATLPDGTRALVFADIPDELQPSAAARSRGPAIAARTRMSLSPVGPPTAHAYGFLVNTNDPLFRQDETESFAYAATDAGLPAAGYGVDGVDLSLDNIYALADGRSFDLLGIDTHGMVYGKAPDFQYAMSSSTPLDAATSAKYATDISDNNVMYSYYLTFSNKYASDPTYAISAGWFFSKLHFNQGAVILNGSCNGHNSDIAANLDHLLRSEGVGTYMGWTKAVQATDSDETAAFIIDRLFGEQSASIDGMANFANQHNPPQRPFPLTDVEGALGNESRSSPLNSTARTESYRASDVGYAPNLLAPPTGSTLSSLDIADYGNENTTSTPALINALPSIASMHVAEGAGGGTLYIDGTFPYTPGSVTIQDAAGTHAFSPSNWTTSEVTVSIPVSGGGSSGMVQVLTTHDADAIASNPVPLTAWTGTLTYNEHDDFTQISGEMGSGTTDYAIAFTVGIRADVHQTVPSIDATPVPQNLAFTNVTGNSSGVVTAVHGTFASDSGNTASLSMTNPEPVLLPQIPLGGSTFNLTGVSGQPSPCNNGSQGAQVGDPGTTFCPQLSFQTSNAAACFDNANGDLCSGYLSPAAVFGSSSGFGGNITFAMDPSTYAISVTSSQASFVRQFGNTYGNAQASVTGSFGPASFSPNSDTPAARARQARSHR